MAIDVNAIQSEFIHIAAERMGALLSTTGVGSEQRPSVIRHRVDGPKPAYPYITLDVTSIDDESGWEILQGADEDGNVFTETVKQLLLVYRVYGSKTPAQSAVYIAQVLNGYLRLSSIRDRVRTALDGSIVTIFGVDSNPVLLVDRYLEAASFNFIINVVDRVEEAAFDPEEGEEQTGVSVIDSISLEPTFDEETLDDNIVVEREEYP